MAIKKSQKLLDMLHIRQATLHPKKSPIIVVNFRPSLSVKIPPKKEKITWTTMAIDRISPIWTSVTPCEYMYRVANGVIKLKGIPHRGSISINVLGFPLLFFSNWSKGWFSNDFVFCSVFTVALHSAAVFLVYIIRNYVASVEPDTYLLYVLWNIYSMPKPKFLSGNLYT